MPTPQQVRAALPELAGLNDDQLVDAVHQLYFGGETRDQVAARMGIAPPPPPPPPPPGLGGRAKDLGISLLKGAIDIPEAAVGLADIPTGGRVGKFLANEGGAIGFRPAEAKAFLDNGYSDAQKEAFRKVGDARGFADTAGAVITNPSTIVQSAAESLPSMLAGGAVSRAALKVLPALSGAAAGAIGEGTVAAGQQVEQTREETPDGLLTPEQVALTAGSGLIDAALAFGGGKLAHSVGATNVATWLSGKSDNVPGVSTLRKVLAGGGEEGLQEFLQSSQEQVLQNKAEGKPLDDGLDQAAVLGLMTGAGMGAGANAIHAGAHAAPVDDSAPPLVPPAPPAAPGDDLRATAPPVSGPTSRAANVAIETGAQQLDANPDAHAAPPGPVPMIPDVHPDHVQSVLDHANARSAQLAEAESGTKEQTIPPATPEGEPTIIPEVPGRHLTPDEKTEQEFLNEHGGDAQAVAHHYTNLIPNIQRQMTESATKMATPEELAAVQPDTAMRAGDIGPGTGIPFTTRGAANLAHSRMEDALAHSVVPVDGGHVIRPNEAPVPLPPAADETPTVTAPDGSQRATFASLSDANKYLKQARKAQGVQGTGVKPVQLPGGQWVLATKAEQAHIAALAEHVPVAAPEQPVPAAPEWQAFPPETGTLGIPRSEMPQVAAEHRGALVNFLKARGVTSEPAAPVDARTLKATQAEFSPAKVEQARNHQGGQRSILISSDGHVVDGHHQAIAADTGPVSAIRLNAPIRELLPLVHEFPSTTTQGGTPNAAALAAARTALPGAADKSDAHVLAMHAEIQAENRLLHQTGNHDTGNRIKDEAIAAFGGEGAIRKDPIGWSRDLTRRLGAAADALDAERSTPGTLSYRQQEAKRRKMARESAAAMNKAAKQEVDHEIARLSRLHEQGRLSDVDAPAIQAAIHAGDVLDQADALHKFNESKDVAGDVRPLATERGEAANETDEERSNRILTTPPAQRTDADLEWHRERGRASRAAYDAQKAEEAATRAKLDDDTNGFAEKAKTPIIQARIRKTLSQHMTAAPESGNGVYESVSRRDLIRRRVEAGAMVGTKEGQRALIRPDGSYLLEKHLTKTGLDYAQHLLDRKQAASGESDQERSGREFRENYQHVAADADLSNSTYRQIELAISYLSHKIVGEQRAAFAGDQAAKDRIGGYTHEIETLKFNLKNRVETPPLQDRSRVGSQAVMDKLAAQGYERADAPRVQVAKRLNGLLDEHSRGQMSDMELIARVDRLAREAAAASNTKQANRMTGERERGADIVREKILAAMRRGDIDRETGEFAQWLVNRDAHLTAGLGISVRSGGDGSAGQYNGASRIMTLFKGADNEGTAVHEILHHTERMMPAGIQDGIHKEWAKRLAAAIAAAEPGSKRAAALQAIIEAVANPSEKAQEVVHDAFAANGPLNYDQDYQLVNPSEFWAVNATRLLQGQFRAQTWLGRAKTWLSAMVQRVRSILGLQSDHPVLRGLEAVINGDGSEQSRRMLSEQATHLANQPAVDGGRRNVLKGIAGSASVMVGMRGLQLANAGMGAEDVPLARATAPATAAPAASASQVHHDLARPPLDALRATSLFMGYKVGDFMGGNSGKVSLWHKTIGTPYHLAQKYPETFGRVFNRIQTFLNDVSYFASDAANLAPTILPKMEGWRDLGKTPVSAADTAAISPAIFSDLDWVRDPDGTARPMTDDERSASAKHEAAKAAVEARNTARSAAHMNDSVEKKQAFLLQGRHVTPEVMRMWQGRPVDEHAKMVDTAFQKAIAEPMPAEPEGIKPGTVFTDAELRQHFHLTDSQIGLYREFRAAVDRSLDHVVTSQMLRVAGTDVDAVRQAAQDAKNGAAAAKLITEHLEKMAEAAGDSPRAAALRSTAETVQKLADRIEELKAQGYAPRSRFGTFALDVVGKDGERQYFQLFETTAERKRAMRQLQESGQFKGSTFTQGTTSQEKYKLFSQMSPDTVELFGDMIGLSATGEQAGDLAFQEFLKRAKANTSAMKHLIHRTGVEGFSRDAGRVLAGFVYSNSRLTSNGLHAGEIQKAVNDIPQGQGQLIDQAYKLMSYVQNPSEDGARLKGLLFAQYLGGSVASALVNATQPFMTTLPYLSQHGGLADAAKHMAGALKLAAKGGPTGNAALDAAMAHYSDAVQPQEVHQMMAQAQGRAALHSGDGTRAGNAAAATHNAMSKIGMAWGKVFGVAESLNRRLTFIAAYNQAVAHGLADPGAYANEAVASTQFIMNKGNKPVAARGAVGGVLFTFKQYSISYLEMMQRLATAGAPGSPERAAGRRAALYAVGAMLMMAGADGLPFIEDIDDVIDATLQRLGYNFHSKVAREAFFKNLFGEDLGKVLTKGLSGLPGAPLDVSGRLGMANLIPGTGLLVDKVDHTSDLMELGGPAADMAKRFGSAAVSLAQGNVGDAATQAAPKALANIIQAAGMWQSGMYKDQSGKKVIDTDFMDGLSKFIGFQPRDVADVQSANFAVTQTIAENRLKQTQIADAMAKARFEGDDDAMAAARADLDAWNAKNPDTPIRIKPADIRTRVKNMSMTKEQRTIKAAPAGIRATVRERLAEAGQ